MNKKEAYKLAELDGIKELKNKIKNIKKQNYLKTKRAGVLHPLVQIAQKLNGEKKNNDKLRRNVVN